MKVQFAQDDVDYIRFAGGLFTVGPHVTRPQGSLAGSLNYEPDQNGGYSRIRGYERFNGGKSPSTAGYMLVRGSFTGEEPAIGATLRVAGQDYTYLGCVLPDALFFVAKTPAPAPGSLIFLGASFIGDTAADSNIEATISAATDSIMLARAADEQRRLIAAVPGTGPVRGVACMGGDVYAWRDGASACVMHKATPTGWQVVQLGWEVAFTNANANVKAGQALTQGGASATVRRVVVESGSLASGTNTGRLVLSGFNGTNFTAAAATVAGGGALTLSGAQVAQAFPKGGSYRTLQHNFAGRSGNSLFGANGVGRAFEFDGTTLTFLHGAQAPTGLVVHLDRLVLLDATSLIFSLPGNPTSYDGVLGAIDIAVGADILDAIPVASTSLCIVTTRSVRTLNGKPTQGMELGTISHNRGGVRGGTVKAVDTYVLRPTGISSVKASDTYGDFAESDASTAFAPAAIQAGSVSAFAVSIATKSHVVFHGTDGSALVCLVSGNKITAAMPLQHAHKFTCGCVMSAEGMPDRQFFGGEDGMVYEYGVGSSFDGGEIEAYLAPNFMSSKSPRYKKSYRDALIDVEARGSIVLSARAELSYADPGKSEMGLENMLINGSGGRWDTALWDAFVWDAAAVATPRLPIRGSGTNISLSFYSKSATDLGHTILSATLRFSKRKVSRG